MIEKMLYTFSLLNMLLLLINHIYISNLIIIFLGKMNSAFVHNAREFDSCLQFFTNQIAQNVDYINAFEFFYCQIRENKCTNMG